MSKITFGKIEPSESTYKHANNNQMAHTKNVNGVALTFGTHHFNGEK